MNHYRLGIIIHYPIIQIQLIVIIAMDSHTILHLIQIIIIIIKIIIIIIYIAQVLKQVLTWFIFILFNLKYFI